MHVLTVAWPRGEFGEQMLPTFCKDYARDFFKMDDKIIIRVVVNIQRSRGRGQEISFIPLLL